MSPKFAWPLLLLLTACTQFEFDVSPPDAAQPVHVGSDQDSFFTEPPLQYQMRADEGHLILWINNPTSQNVELLGDVSHITDSDGITHPLRGQTLSPFSRTKFILPPLGDSDDGPPAPNYPPNPSPADQPGILSLPDEGDQSQLNPRSWEWSGETDIQIDLTFLQDKKQFSHHFSIRRVRK